MHSDKYLCNECGFRARTPRDLITHKRKHTNDKPFVCPNSQCKQLFKFKCNLVRHQKIKHKLGYKRANPYDLGPNKQTLQSKDRRYECPNCECKQRFKTQALLKRDENRRKQTDQQIADQKIVKKELSSDENSEEVMNNKIMESIRSLRNEFNSIWK